MNATWCPPVCAPFASTTTPTSEVNYVFLANSLVFILSTLYQCIVKPCFTEPPSTASILREYEAQWRGEDYRYGVAVDCAIRQYLADCGHGGFSRQAALAMLADDIKNSGK